MKDYEKRRKLEAQLLHAEYNFKKLNNNVENQKKNIAILKKRHSMIELEEVTTLQHFEDDKALFFDVMKDCKKRLKTFKNRGKPKPKPPKPEPVLLPKKEPISTASQDNLDLENTIHEGQKSILQEIKDTIEDDIQEIIVEGKVKCPECAEHGVEAYFTKGGAFASHYKSHFKNGNGD